MSDYLMGRQERWPLTTSMLSNAEELLRRVNAMLETVPLPQTWKVSSGYRPAEINAKTPNAAKRSLHMTCQAVDIIDDGRLAAWCKQPFGALEKFNLWMESPDKTPTWCHLQSVAPRSGKRIFLP
jgi:hypothetical protein